MERFPSPKLEALRRSTSGLGRSLRRNGVGGLAPLYRQNLATVTRPEWVEPRINALQLEPTKRCNQKCPMCTQPTLPKEETGDMTFEQFLHIVEQFPYLNEIKLQGLGEIFLNRDIWTMLDYLAERRIRVLFATNGLLCNEAAAHKLVRLENLDVRFSVDSLDRERYADIRGVDTLERVERNLRTFCRVRAENGRRTALGRWSPSAEIRMVCMDENFHELPAMLRFAADVGLERVTASFMLTKRHSDAQSAAVQGKATSLEGSGLGAVEAEARRVSREVGVGLKLMGYVHDILATCDWPWRMPYITFDGYVTTCCHVENPSAGNLGNVLETPFAELWNGPAYRALRQHFTDLEKNTLCRVCPYLSEEQTRPYREAAELISADRLLQR